MAERVIFAGVPFPSHLFSPIFKLGQAVDDRMKFVFDVQLLLGIVLCQVVHFLYREDLTEDFITRETEWMAHFL